MTSEEHTEFKIGSKTKESRNVDILEEDSKKKNQMLKVLEIFKGEEKKNAKLSYKYKGLKDWLWAHGTYLWTLRAGVGWKDQNAIVSKTKQPLCRKYTF